MSERVSTSNDPAGGLLRGGVFQRADAHVYGRVQRLVGQLVAERLGQAEIDDLGHRLAIDDFDEHVARLEVAVDDAFLMGVLHGVADRG